MGRDTLEDEDGEDGFYASGNERDREDGGIGSNSGLEPDEALDSMELNDLMLEGRKMLLQDLIKAVKQGIATPAEKNTLRQMLKDNGVIVGDPNAGAQGGQNDKPKAPLPSFSRPDYT